MPFGRKSPLEALALPGVILAYKYSQFRQRRREAASRRVTERELAALHHKIDKLLNKLEESEPDPPTSQEDECVICINARATMQTSPCGHRVVCRRCFVKTIQSAVAQRLLPLRCVICRARVNRLTSSSGTWRIQESASSYSMGAKSWASAGVAAGGVPASASSYSMGDTPCSSGHPHHPHHTQGFHQPLLHPRYAASSASSSVGGPRIPNGRVPQSASLYSMSSTGSSSMSGVSHMSGYSKTSSVSSALCGSPLSPGSAATGAGGGGAPPTAASILNNHLAPPTITHASGSLSSPSASSGGSISPRDPPSTPSLTHSHHSGCPSGCSGAIPRKPLNSLSNSSSSGSCSSSSGYGGGGHYATANDSSPTAYCSTPLPGTGTYPGRRHTKGRLMDLQNRLPPIKEFRSPAKVPHPSPVHVSNPRFRYASYTKSSSAHEMAPLLREPPSPPKRPMNIQITTSLTTLAPPPLKAIGSKISPMTSRASLPKNAYLPSGKEKKQAASNAGKEATRNATSAGNLTLGASKKYTLDSNANAKAPKAAGLAGPAAKASSAQASASSAKAAYATCSSSRSFPLFSSKEKSDNKKNESMERKKKDEKLKLKAEKEARKEEKRLAKEEERLAKVLAKEEKKKGKKEAKELLLANDGNNKK